VLRLPRIGRAKQIEGIALLATIPAFYLALLSVHRGVSALLYLLACGATAATAWQSARDRRAAVGEGGAAGTPRRQADQLGLVLAAALFLSGVLPGGGDADLLVVRLGTAALIVLRLVEPVLPAPWRGSLPQLLALAVSVLGLCGLGFWWLEPRALSFGDGLWLAFTTAATVGYGDIVPSTPAAKIFAVFVVLLGLAVLSLVTASIAALWVQTEERRIERELLHELHHELRAIRHDLNALRHAARPESPTPKPTAPPDA
jgi:voltage-gated potassium channel